VSFVWIGEGRERQALERAFARLRLGNRARVLGFRRDVHELVAQLTLFVSASRQEGLGTAVLEAQALGVPVVAADSGGVRDSVLDGSNGRLVASPDGLGAAVRDALGDPATLARWRAAALMSVERFSPESMVEGTLAEYARVLAEAHAGASD
jgi:glycosyltransferase involved in cell wall biosynthesis